MSHLDFEIATFLRYLANNPVVVLHVLAYASAITLIIAILTDAFLAQRQAVRSGKTVENGSKKQSDLTPRQLPGFETIRAARRPAPSDRK